MFPNGYNPFEVDNVLGNHMWLRYAQDNMATYFRRRGLVFVDGKPLEPVETSCRVGRAFAAVDELLHRGALEAAVQGVLSGGRQGVDRNQRHDPAHSSGQ